MANAGYKGEVYIEKYDLTETFKSADVNAETDLADVSTFRIKGKKKLPLQDDGSISLEGVWSVSADGGLTEGPEEFFSRVFSGATLVPVTVALQGGGLGDSCRSAQVYDSAYSVKLDSGDAIRFNVTLDCHGGMDFGKIAWPLGAVTATTTGSAVDLGRDPLVGRAYLHLIEATGTNPTATVTIEDSADGTTGWATVGTFTGLTSTETSEVINLATLKQFVRVKAVIAGTNPSFNFVVAVCGREML